VLLCDVRINTAAILQIRKLSIRINVIPKPTEDLAYWKCELKSERYGEKSRVQMGLLPPTWRGYYRELDALR